MAHQVDYNQFAADDRTAIIKEASDIGLKPGQWPRAIDGQDVDGSDDEFIFVCTVRRVHADDIQEVRYSSHKTNRRLVVIND